MSNDMLEAGLAYARMGWKCFPLHGIADGRCTCGKAHKDGKGIGKHPRTVRGFKEATTDPAQITRWFQRWPDSNIGIATGDGLVVVDVDGAEGEAELRRLVADNEALPKTLVGRTGGGWHIILAARAGAPEVRSAARGHVHVRAAGGYICAPPSRHANGRTYQWVRKYPVAELPEWLRQWLSGYEITAKTPTGAFDLGPMPGYLQNTKTVDVSNAASDALRTQWSEAEQARLISALSSIPVKSCNYDDFLRIGFALHGLGWDRSDGTSIAFDIWDEWCRQSEHHNPAGLEEKWRNFDRTARGDVTLGTIYHKAREAGWNGGAPDPSPKPFNGLNGHPPPAQALPVAFGGQSPIFFPDMTEEGKIRATMLNAKVAIGALGLECRYDLFHNRMLVGGELISKWNSAELSDHITTMIRDVIRYRYGFDPNKANVQDACEALCLARRFDPVVDYLDSLQWDGRPRLGNWLAAYMGAADNDYTRAVGTLSLLAAVRRARAPGTKFDQIIVLEGKQGQGKSEAIEILAGPDNFSDQSILGVDDRKQQELTEGVWLYEIGELSGLRKAEVEHVKAFASRKRDRARPAYGRYVVTQPRRTVFFASTNNIDEGYLQDETGNRRFWPVRVDRLDLAGLRRDRDQLWAEAAALEVKGASHVLPERLWSVAAEEQDRRQEADEWAAAIHNFVTMPDKPRTDVCIMDVLAGNQFLQLEQGRVGRREQMRAGTILRRLGFTKYRKRLAGNAYEWRYRL